MHKFILWRLVQFPVILAVIYLVTFLMIWVVPGSPFEGERNMDPAKLQQMREQFNADKWYKFLGYYPLRIVTHGDFGPSMHNKEFTVNQLIKGRFPVSVQLGFAALGVAVVFGMLIGTLSAVWRDGVLDWAGMSLTLVGISVPAFVTAAVLLLVFIAKLGWFGLGGVPDFDSAGLLVMLSLVLVAGGMALAFTEVLWLAALAAGAAFLWGLAFVYPVLSFETFGLTLALLLVIAALKVDAEWLKRTLAGVAMAVVVALVVGLVSALPAFDGLQNLLLPAVALSLAPMAYIVRLQRVSMLDVLGADYVRTARAKGLSKPRVVIKHCLRNAFLPVFTYLGPAAAVTLTGSFVVERVFNIPGMGQMFVDSVTNRDQTLILALVMVYSALVLSFNLLVDLGYAFIDPRIDVTAGR